MKLINFFYPYHPTICKFRFFKYVKLIKYGAVHFIIFINIFEKLTFYIKNIQDTTFSNRLMNVQHCCNVGNQS